MDIIIKCIILSFSVFLLCTGFALLCRFIVTRNKANKEKKSAAVFDFIIKRFFSLHVHFLFILVVFSVICLFPPFYRTDMMYAAIILAVIAVLIERLAEYMQINFFYEGHPDYQVNNIAVFAYIDLYSEIEKVNLGLIKQLSESQSGMMSQFEIINNKKDSIMEKIDNYAQLQNTECKELLERKNDINNFFNELSNKTSDFCDVFTEYEKKLENSCKALVYYEESGSLIADVNESFLSKYKQSAGDFIRRMDDIERHLKRIVDEYSKLNDYIQPHMQRVSVYNSRMDTVLNNFKNEVEYKHSLLDNTSKEIAGAVRESNKNINETLGHLNSYLEKNSFVLSKIFNSYEKNPITPRKLKKILKNWPETSK